MQINKSSQQIYLLQIIFVIQELLLQAPMHRWHEDVTTWITPNPKLQLFNKTLQLFIIFFQSKSLSREYNVVRGSCLNSKIVNVSSCQGSRLMCKLQLGLPTLSINV
jgi:hypothetical protein